MNCMLACVVSQHGRMAEGWGLPTDYPGGRGWDLIRRRTYRGVWGGPSAWSSAVGEPLFINGTKWYRPRDSSIRLKSLCVSMCVSYDPSFCYGYVGEGDGPFHRVPSDPGGWGDCLHIPVARLRYVGMWESDVDEVPLPGTVQLRPWYTCTDLWIKVRQLDFYYLRS